MCQHIGFKAERNWPNMTITLYYIFSSDQDTICKQAISFFKNFKLNGYNGSYLKFNGEKLIK